MDLDSLQEYISKLNQEQQLAATYGQGSVLVLAAAGSGKTSTLTCRIAHLIGNEKIPAHNILAVTFTNKAAKEMIARLQKMGVDTKSLWIGTFHGICNRILRYHAKEAGIQKNFYIMDSQEQLSFMKRMLRANGYDPKAVNVDDLQDKINGYKEVGWRSNQLRINSQERRFYEYYEAACLKDNCLDFGELLLGCYELFRNHPDIGDHYAEKFKHILVDEFQDTSELQYKWLQLLANENRNLFAVGDDDQCLPKGTLISTPLGQIPIENVNTGDLVLSKIGNHLITKKVIDKFEKDFEGNLIKITLEDRRILTSTAEHNWFAGFIKTDSLHHIMDEKNANNNIIVTLCSEKRGETALHTLEYLTDNPVYKEILENNNFNLKSHKKETFKLKVYSMDYKNIALTAKKINSLLKNTTIVFKAKIHKFTLNQLQANDIMPGMVMIDEEHQERIVINVEQEKVKTKIYDLNIENTHNYFANGVVTHNSIYSFRGAKPENLNVFIKDFNAQIIKIEKNYRSDAYILQAANAVIANNTNRQGKNLVPTKPAHQLLGLYTAFNDEQESAFVASEIKRMRRAGIQYRQMAILYRTNGQSRSIEKGLMSQNIPYIVYGGFRFFDRQEVKHAMAYLRLANNPHDNMAFIRVANLPARAIGDSALKKLEVSAQENNCSLYEMAKSADTKTIKKFLPFIEVIEKLQNYCKGKKLTDMVRNVIIYSGLEEMYEKDQKDGEERLDNLYELISAAEVFMAENKEADIDEFLAFSTLDSDVASKKRDPDADTVRMMTVHASKGLEFEIVFATGMEENLFPHANSIGEPSAIEEERRLMYVAITRAKEMLYLSNCEERLIHGQRQRFIRSRFLKEIPSKLIQKLN